MSAITALTMLVDGVVGLVRPQLIVMVMEGDGWPPETVLPIALAALTAGIFYLIPRTAVLGAILITGFCGGALAVHLRVTLTLIWPEVVNIVIAGAAWAGLALRNPRLKAVLLGRP